MGIDWCGLACSMAIKMTAMRVFSDAAAALGANHHGGRDLRRRKCPAPYPRFTSDITTGRSAFVTVRVTTRAGR
jgi:hypothetical protein